MFRDGEKTMQLDACLATIDDTTSITVTSQGDTAGVVTVSDGGTISGGKFTVAGEDRAVGVLNVNGTISGATFIVNGKTVIVDGKAAWFRIPDLSLIFLWITTASTAIMQTKWPIFQ